ncbi:uncharacterized protein C1orf167 homolog [Trichechus manatus latirostris]|uniref:Uncharacterized protein C1orf167 homolog n=1 Tax=Trichechus manatus latirostris TaxID=127582 RepID=A0A2Y9QX73_TRIMA|nr:uncharacterized protein C1orf167 homolog [Trichechus manatus latirostris]
MELRPDTSHKENVPPRPAAPLRPEPWRFLKNLGVGLGSGHGQRVPVHQARRGGPAATPSPRTVLRQEPCLVQTNLASPGPSPGLALEDTIGRRATSSFLQQSNLQPRAGRPHLRAQSFAIQQSNLSLSKTSFVVRGNRTSSQLWSEPQESFSTHTLPWGSPLCCSGQLTCPSLSLRQSQPRAPDTPCPDFRPLAGFIPQDGCPQPGTRSWFALGRWTSGPVGEPLTLEDLAVPAQSQAQAPSHAGIQQSLASVRCLEHEASRVRCWASQEPLGPVRQDLWASGSQAVPAHHQPSQPALACWDERHRCPRSLREKTQGAQAGLSDSQANSQPVSAKTTFGMLTRDPLDPEQGVLPAHPLSGRGNCSPGPAYGGGQRGSPSLPQGAGNREARLCSSTFSSVAWGVLPGQEGGEGAPREQVRWEEERTASSHPPDTISARSALQNKAPNIVTLETKTACWQLLPRCFRAWRHLVQKPRAVAAAEALCRRQLLRKGLRALRWALHLQEAWLEVASGRHMKTLLARSFREWRELAAQQKQKRPHIQAVPESPASGGGWGQGPSGRKAAVDLASSSSPCSQHRPRAAVSRLGPCALPRPGSFTVSPGSLKKEEGGRPIPSHPGLRPDGRDTRIQILQALQRLAVLLLWCHQKGLARQERGIQREAAQAPPRTQRAVRPPKARHAHVAAPVRVVPLETQCQRAWLCRCFGAWQRFAQRGARCRDHLADRRVGTLSTCLRQWVQMKQLRASDGVKVTQLSLCRQKAGTTALRSPAPEAATAQGPGAVAQAPGLLLEQGQGSLQEACRRLALHRVLLLWRMQLSQRRQANFFLQGLQQRTLQHVLCQWRSRAWGLCTPSSSTRTTSALESPGSGPGGEASLGCSTPCGSLERPPRDPALLETLRATFLRATRQRRQEQSLLLWQARARQARAVASQYQRTLQRRVLLSWSHWTTAQGARRELAAHWAWAQSCKAALGLWRQQLAQWRAAEQWAQQRGRRLAQDALRRWHSCWQRQQILQEKYEAWAQVHLQGLQRAMFQSWQRAAGQRRHMVTGPEQLLLRSHFRSWCGLVREAGVLQAQHRAFQAGWKRRALEAAFAAWREALVAASRTQEQHVAWDAIAHWSRAVQQGRARKQLRRAWAQQAFTARRGALGLRLEAHRQAEEGAQAQVQAGVALCWTLSVRESCLCQVSRAYAARKLRVQVLEAWAQAAAQARVQRAAFAQLRQAGLRLLLRTHWAQWQTALLRVQQEAWAEAEEAGTVHPRPRADHTHCLRLANRGRLLLLMDAPAPWKQTRSCWTQAPGLGLPGTAQHHHLSGQSERQGMPWAQGDREQDLRWPLAPCRPPLRHAVQLWLQPPVRCHRAQGLPLCMTPSRPPTGPAGDCSSESRALKGTREAYQRRLGQLCVGVLDEGSCARGVGGWLRAALCGCGGSGSVGRGLPEPGPELGSPGQCSLLQDLEKQAQASGFAALSSSRGHAAQGTHGGFSPQDESTALAPGGTASPVPGLPAGQVPGNCMAALGRCSWGRTAGTDPSEWRLPQPRETSEPRGSSPHSSHFSTLTARKESVFQTQTVAPEMGLEDMAAAGAAAAFEKWHQRLAAKGRSGANSSLRPPSKLEDAQAPGHGGLRAELGPSCSCDLFS